MDIVIGTVSGVFGVRGWVKVRSSTEPREALLTYNDCYLRVGEERRGVKIAEGKLSGKHLLARFAGIDDRNAAEALIGAELVVPRSALPALEEGHYYWADLEGLAVRDKAGAAIGRVSHLLATGANDVLVVVDGDKEVLIPFLYGTAVLDVDLTEGSITVDWNWD